MHLNMSALSVALCATLAGASLVPVANAAYISANYYGTDSANIKGGNGDLSTQAVELTGGNQWITLGVKNTTYDFSGVAEPFDNLTKLYVDLRYRGHIYSNMAYYVGMQLGSKFEDNMSLSDDYSVSPRAVIGWEFANGMTAFFGGYADFNGADNIFLPVIGLEVGRGSELGLSGAIAYPATKIQYRFTPQLAADATFLTVRDTYHLDKDVKKGVISDGYVREESYGVSVGVTYNPFQHVSLSGGLFSYFDRSFEFFTNSGREIDSFDVDNTYGAYIRANMSF